MYHTEISYTDCQDQKCETETETTSFGLETCLEAETILVSGPHPWFTAMFSVNDCQCQTGPP